MMMEEEEDEVIRELDVCISPELSLHLLQFPLKPVYSDQLLQVSRTAYFKPINKKLELEVPFGVTKTKQQQGLDDRGKQSDGGQQQNRLLKYASSAVGQDANLVAAIIKNNVMYLSPVQSTLQMRPSFKSMQSFRQEVVEDYPMEFENDGAYAEGLQTNESEAAAGGALQQVQFKRKESEKAQSARIQSFSYMQAQEDQETWEKLQVHKIGEPEELDVIASIYPSLSLL